MKIQDVVVGAVATLIVTVLGGVGVYYATKEPDEKRAEKLVYTLDQTRTFAGGDKDIAISAVRISNEGGAAAKRPTLTIDLTEAEIRDLSVAGLGGLREVTRERTPQRLRITFETLLPRETISVSLLLSRSEKPKIDFRSDSSLGEERTLSSGLPAASRTEKLNLVSGIAVPVGAFMSLTLWAFMAFRLRSGGIIDLIADRNDAGFLLLHNGLVNDAAIVLGEAIRAGRCDSLVLSNYALCRALAGSFDDAEKLLLAAKFRERKWHSRAVVLFNESLIRLLKNDESTSMAKLREAVQTSRQIKRYAEKSIHFDAVRDTPAYKAAVGSA